MRRWQLAMIVLAGFLGLGASAATVGSRPPCWAHKGSCPTISTTTAASTTATTTTSASTATTTTTVTDTGTASNIASLRLGSSYPSGTHYPLMQSLVVGIGDAAAAAALTPTLSLLYVSGIQVERNTADATITGGISIDTARTNGWLLHKNGSELGFSGGTTSLANVSLTAYQDAWTQSVLGLLRQYGLDGIHVDNFEMSLANFRIGYPTDEAMGRTQSAFEDAQVAFAAGALAQIKAAGYYVLVNGAGMLYGQEDVGRPNTDNGDLTNYWVDRWHTYASALEVEYWQQSPGNAALLRNSGDVNPYPFWEGWEGVAAHAQADGLGFHGLVYGGAADLARCWYVRGSWLLEWDGQHGAFAWAPTDNTDNWNTCTGTLTGAPLGQKEQLAPGVFKRAFADGTIWVNSTVSQVTVAGLTLPAVSAVWG